MTVQEQQRQNTVVLRIRELQDKKRQQYGGLNLTDETEIIELQTEANENNWMYWQGEEK